MKPNTKHAHIDSYESCHEGIRPLQTAAEEARQPTPYARQDPTISTKLRYVKPQHHRQNVVPRVTEKWLSAEAHEAFTVAAHYVSQLVVGEKPVSYELYTPNRLPSFYQAMGIGVRTYLHADVAATGEE